jgi:CSLREA domain-containing protein
MWRRLLATGVVLASAWLPGTAPAHAVTTITVDTFEDSYDGSCGDGDCSLRDAVASAPVRRGRIVLPAGYYTLDVPEAGTGPADGSVEFARPGGSLTIEGRGETGTFVDGSALGSSMFRAVSSTLRLRDLTLLGGAVTSGGPIATASGGTLVFRHVTLTGGDGVEAGAVFVDTGGSATFVDSLLLGNRASDGAGAVEARGGVSAWRSAFVGNVGERGGAIAGDIDRLRNVTFSGNRARTVGGAYWSTSAFPLSNVTIAGNRAPRGGAVAAPRGTAGALGLADHVIVADNATAVGGQCRGDMRSSGRNVEDGRSCDFDRASDRAGADPLLGPLASNGGPTPTRALRIGSPAIDVGGDCADRDQRGAPRGDPCDAGAYELVLCGGRAVDIVGTRGDDDLSGGREPDTFLGLGGDDFFQGSLADDIACGGRGDDVLWGGPAGDLLRGGAGVDRLDGEGGVDRCVGGPGRDRFRGCEDQRTSRRLPGGQ